MNTIKLDCCYHDIPKKGDVVELKNNRKYIVSNVEQLVSGEGMDIEWSTRYTLKKMKWYHRVWYWIKNIYGN